MLWLFISIANHPEPGGLKTTLMTISFSLQVCNLGKTQQGQLISAAYGINQRRSSLKITRGLSASLFISVYLCLPSTQSLQHRSLQVAGFPTQQPRALDVHVLRQCQGNAVQPFLTSLHFCHIYLLRKSQMPTQIQGEKTYTPHLNGSVTRFWKNTGDWSYCCDFFLENAICHEVNGRLICYQ